MHKYLALTTTVVAFGLSGCATTSDLEQEIAAIDARVRTVEQDITTATEAIGAPGKDVRAQVSYRPLISWANAFSARPAGQRTIQFRQTTRDGDLYEREHECKFSIPGGWRRRDGKRAWIHESDSTKVSMEIGRFTVVPTASGLDLRTDLKIDGRTQVGANYRVACGPSVGTNIGVSAEARPSALMRVTVASGPDGTPTYRLAVVSPDTVGMEMRAHFNWFDVGFTIPMRNLAREVASGDLDLMFAKQGQIILPGGEVRTYRLATVDPSVSTSTQGLNFGSDLSLVIE